MCVSVGKKLCKMLNGVSDRNVLATCPLNANHASGEFEGGLDGLGDFRPTNFVQYIRVLYVDYACKNKGHQK